MRRVAAAAAIVGFTAVLEGCGSGDGDKKEDPDDVELFLNTPNRNQRRKAPQGRTLKPDDTDTVKSKLNERRRAPRAGARSDTDSEPDSETDGSLDGTTKDKSRDKSSDTAINDVPTPDVVGSNDPTECKSAGTDPRVVCTHTNTQYHCPVTYSEFYTCCTEGPWVHIVDKKGNFLKKEDGTPEPLKKVEDGQACDRDSLLKLARLDPYFDECEDHSTVESEAKGTMKDKTNVTVEGSVKSETNDTSTVKSETVVPKTNGTEGPAADAAAVPRL